LNKSRSYCRDAKRFRVNRRLSSICSKRFISGVQPTERDERKRLPAGDQNGAIVSLARFWYTVVILKLHEAHYEPNKK
jgi:hypothetical protein